MCCMFLIIIEGPGHFMQEEAGPEYEQLIIDFIYGNPQPFKIKQDSIDKKYIL